MRRHVTGRLLLTAGVALAPWLAVLWTTMPNSYPAQHWRLAWVGFDVLEIAGLLTSAVLLRSGDRRAPLASIATAALLLVDAWFDVTTSGHGLAFALVVACAVELPLAALCAVVALRSPAAASPRAASTRRGAAHA